jgi:large subunit ribosomal protein L18
MKSSKERSVFRKKRVRNKISGTSERPRLNIKCGHKNIYAQVIDDSKGITLVAASTLSAELKGKFKAADTVEAAKAVGKLIAQKAIEKKVDTVVFDRAGKAYVGKVKALAEEARTAGLKF